MTGNTHATVGVACSLLILQPKTVPECLCALAGGLIGGVISDIDSPGKRDSLDYSDDPFAWQIYVFIIIILGLFIGLDYISGEGAVDYIINNFGTNIVVGVVAFLGLCFYGAHTNHRTFTHSIIAGLLFSISVWSFCRPLAIPFAIGFASHLILDFFNKKKVQYFWPLPPLKKLGINRFPSDGRLNEVLGGIGTISSIYMFVYFFINCFANSLLATRMMHFFSKHVTINNFDIPLIVPYLLLINVIALVVYLLDYNLYMRGKWFYSGSEEEVTEMEEFILTLLLVIDLTGGMIGKLIAVFITQKGKIYKGEALGNYNLYIIPVCFLISWLTILYTFFIPTVSVNIKPLYTITIRGISILHIISGYFIFINLLAIFMFPRMRRFALQISPREKLCMILSLLGGATGGYISMKITGNHENTSMLASSLPEMIIMHATVLTCFFYIV